MLIQDQVDCARIRGAIKDLLPGRASVARSVDAAIRARAEAVAESGHVNHIGIGGMYADAGDVARRRKANILPRAAAIGCFVDTVAVGCVSAETGFAHAGVDYIRIRRRNRDRSD